LNLSLNEVESTVWKAARGAGLAWGLAEETGQAARWMADRGLAWAEPVVACLEDAERRHGEISPPVLVGDTWRAPVASQALSPLLCGPLISDLASTLRDQRQSLRLGSVAQPILLLPFVARAAEALNAELKLAWPGAAWLCRADGTHFSTPSPAPAASGVEIGSAGADDPLGGEPILASGAERRNIPAGLLHRLESWVRLTYVPATAESRLLGAGAGLTDND
jgi:hypothetical protein